MTAIHVVASPPQSVEPATGPSLPRARGWATGLWKECPAERRKEADGVLLDALGFEPDVVFDTLVECRDLLAKTDPADLRKLLDTLPTDNADAQLARAMLLAAFPLRPSGFGGQVAREGVAPDLFVAAERRVLAKLQGAEGPAARWLGYLALLDNEMLRVPTLGYLILEQVPVGVCDRCGMRYYDCSVVKRAEDVYNSGGTATRPVPVAPYRRLSSA